MGDIKVIIDNNGRVDFRSHIKDSIDESAVVLAIVGPGWVNPVWTKRPGLFTFRRAAEDFVAVELDLATQQNVPILPILIDSTAMPAANVLPAAIKTTFPFLNGSAVRAGRDFRADMDRVVAAIRPLRGPAPPADTASSEPKQPPANN